MTQNQPIGKVVREASVRDLVTLVQYGKTKSIKSVASYELMRRDLCGNCGSSAHTFCNR